MNPVQQLAKHLRDVHFGGNWTAVNLKETVSGISWQQATEQVATFHSIAELVFHMNYFVKAVVKVLQGGPLDAHDKFSFDAPSIRSQTDWDEFLQMVWADAEEMANLIEKLPEEQLEQDFAHEKYGSYHRNFLGVIEHCHYHLGQIVLIKKLIQSSTG